MGLRDADTVTAPDGVRWTVRRHWHKYRIHWWGPRHTSSFDWIDVGGFGDDALSGGILGLLLIATLVVLAVVFVLPAMVLLVELLVVAVSLAVSVGGRLLLGRPWEIEAVGSDGRERRWLVKGWAASGRAITSIAWALQNGTQVALPEGGYEVVRR